MNVKKNFLVAALVFISAFVFAPARAQLTMPNGSNAGVEAEVNSYFAQAPQMIAIAECESGFRQFGSNGLPLLGGTGANYVGVFQISQGHQAAALALGFDIYTMEGNLGYANYLYQNQGTEPWLSCASNSAAPQTNPIASSSLVSVTTVSLTANLDLGMTSPQVLILQQLLNAEGFTVAASGPGSPGNETTKFGALTLAALERFQCSQNIVCSGNQYTTGYGHLGPLTRAALLAAANKSAP